MVSSVCSIIHLETVSTFSFPKEASYQGHWFTCFLQPYVLKKVCIVSQQSYSKHTGWGCGVIWDLLGPKVWASVPQTEKSSPACALSHPLGQSWLTWAELGECQGSWTGAVAAAAAVGWGSGAAGTAAAAVAAGRRLSPWVEGTSLPSGLGECTGDIWVSSPLAWGPWAFCGGSYCHSRTWTAKRMKKCMCFRQWMGMTWSYGYSERSFCLMDILKSRKYDTAKSRCAKRSWDVKISNEENYFEYIALKGHSLIQGILNLRSGLRRKWPPLN